MSHARPIVELLIERLPDRGDGCWPWNGVVSRYGYGVLQRTDGQHRAHRLAYETWVGPLGDEPLDHQCHTEDPSCPGGITCPHRRCCNPTHLRPSTTIENVMLGRSAAAENARKELCLNGHPFDLVRVTPAGNIGRGCSICRNRRARDARARKRARVENQG